MLELLLPFGERVLPLYLFVLLAVMLRRYSPGIEGATPQSPLLTLNVAPVGGVQLE